MQDKRKNPRFERILNLKFLLDDKLYSAEIKNFSLDGTLLEVSFDAALSDNDVGKEIYFRDGFQYTDFLRPKGEIVRYFETENKKGIAVRFF